MGGCRLFFSLSFFGFFFLMLLFNRHNKKNLWFAIYQLLFAMNDHTKHLMHAEEKSKIQKRHCIVNNNNNNKNLASQPVILSFCCWRRKKTCFFCANEKKNLSQDNSLITIRSNDNLVCFFSHPHICVCV